MASRLELIRNQIKENNPNSGLLAMSDQQLVGYLHTNKYSDKTYDELQQHLLGNIKQDKDEEIENPYQQGWGQKVYQSLFGAVGDKGLLSLAPKEVRRSIGGIPQNIAEGTSALFDFLKLKDKTPDAVKKSAQEFANFTSTAIAGPELMSEGQVEEPTTVTGSLVKELGTFAIPYAGSMKLLGAGQKVLEAKKINKLQKAYQDSRIVRLKPKFPKTLAATKMLASGEIASQWVIKPEDAFFGELLGQMVGDDNEQLSELLDFVTADKDKTEGENRIALLFDGLFMTGVIGGVIKIGGLTFKSGREMFNYFKNVKNSATPEQKETIVETIKEASTTPKANKTPEQIKKPGGDETPVKLWSESSNSFLRGLSQTGTVTKDLFFSARGFFSPEAFALFNKSKDAKLAWASKGEQLMTTMERQIRTLAKEGRWFGVNKQVEKEANAVLDGYLQGSVKEKDLPKSMQSTAKEMRDTVDELSRFLSQSKVVDKELREEIVENLGSYLRKTYKKFENPDWKPSQEVIDRAENFIYGKLKSTKLKRSQDKTDETLRNEAKAEVKNLLSNAKYSKNFFDFTDIIYGAKDGKKLFRERQKIAQPIRDLLGEEDNPSVRVFSTIRTLSEYLYDRNLMEKYYRLGNNKFFFENATGNYRRKIEGKQFGPLDGMYTDTKTYATLVKPLQTNINKSFFDNVVGETTLGVAKLAFAAKGFAQSAATVINNITHERNLFGSAKILLNNGINPLSKDTWESLRTVTTKIRGSGQKEYQDLYNKYLSLGIVNQNARLGDLRLLMESASKTNAGNWLNQYNPFKKIYKKLEDIYVAEDDIWKIVAFEKELKTLQRAYPNKGVKELEEMAAKIVRNTMPTYDMIPTGIKALRYSPYGNFFSFHVERFRNIFHTYKQGFEELNSGNKVLQQRGALRLGSQTTLGTGVGASAADYLTGNMSGLSEEERYHLKEISKQEYNGDRWIWDMNKDGKIVWADLKFNDPDAPVSETIMYPIYDAIFGKGKLDQREFDERLGQAFATSLKEFFEPLTTETLLSEAIIDKLFRNGKTEDGQYIDDYIVSESPDFEIYANNQIASWKHIAEKLYKVGAYKNLERYAKAKSGDKDIYGVGYDLSSEKLANFTGFRFNVIDDKRLLKSLHMELFKFNRERSNATTVMYTDIKKKETTVQDFVNNYTLANKMYYKQYVKTKNKLHSLKELMEFDNLREKEGKEKIYNLNQSKIDLVVNERIQSSIVEDDFKIFTPQIDYFKPIEPSTEKIDEFMQMHPDVNRSELKNILKQISNDFRKLPLLELKEDYNDEQLEVIERLGLAKGGFVKGPDVVPFTKEDPADRINPLTGLSYGEESERKQFAEGGAIEFRNNQESDRLMKNIAKAFPSIENQQSFIQNISKTLGKNVKSLDNKSLALVTARILDTFYPAQDNRNNNMLKSFSFGNYSNQREKVLKYNETVAIKRINNYFEKQKNLQASGWNPTKTAELLKGRDTYNVGGIVLRKVMQLKAAGKDVEYDPSAAQKTQIATTGGTYEKASKIMDDYNAYDSLDYGSGIQINQARQVLKADTYEPYPQLDKADKYGTPDFVEPEEITRKYNFITNFSVLNVLPKLDRDKAVKHIGSLLQDNGVAVITVRSKDDVLKALPNAKKQLSDSELITARGTYQKGFTRDELKKYLSETLGKDYEVMDLPNKYKMSGVGVLIKKSLKKVKENIKPTTNKPLEGEERKKALNEYRELQKFQSEKYKLTSDTQFFSDVEMYELKQLNSQLADARYKIDAGRNFKLPSEGSKLSYGRDFTVLKSDSIIPTAATDMYRNKNIFNALYQHAAGHQSGGKQYTIVDNILMGKNPDISPLEFYNNFAKTREELKKAYGDTITLYRLERSTKLIDEVGEKPITNWMHKGKLFEMLKEQPAYKNATEIKKDIKVDDVVALNLGGTYGNYNEFLIKSDLFDLDRLKELSTKENRFNFEKGGKVSTNEQMDRLGFEGGGPVLPEYRGRDAYEKAIQKFAESEKDAQLLREFAWVESKFANDPTTFRKDNRSAYQITPIRFQDFKDSLNDKSETGAGLRRYIDKMEKKYNTNYRDIKYDDLNNPEIGTVVTRALLKRVPEPIGETPEQRAVQWKRDWNTELGAGTVEKYLTDLKYLD